MVAMGDYGLNVETAGSGAVRSRKGRREEVWGSGPFKIEGRNAILAVSKVMEPEIGLVQIWLDLEEALLASG
jgi:hypothetical protein